MKETDVKRRILSALHRHANVEASKIQISVRDGKVTLDGVVDVMSEKDMIEDAIWSIPGVNDVVDHLSVQ